jgi:hypothetical protein
VFSETKYRPPLQADTPGQDDPRQTHQLRDDGARLDAEAGALAVLPEAAVDERRLARDPRCPLGVERERDRLGDVGRDADATDGAGVDLDALDLGSGSSCSFAGALCPRRRR